MAGYFEEMGWTELGDGETPNQLLHLARLLRDFGMFEELGEGKRLPPPASKRIVNNLPELEIKQAEESCPVCLIEFRPSDKTKVLPCDHKFHPQCILPWLAKTNTCPFCRHELETDDEQYEEYRKAKLREKQREEDIETLHNSMFS
ncbi:hypothetical protein AAG570_002312 [Ranatra chinensis]|uniref:E3 ubiquitin-protein ligase RNF181 n=1 Tax=Ranatra chinensis TaxID=642074 RepID=A0ABD0Y764_9HEMI